eukprot:8625642-Lingulodinium_polyedra.AAC.1
MSLGPALALVHCSAQGDSMWFSNWAAAHVVILGSLSRDAGSDNRMGSLQCPAVTFKLGTVVRWLSAAWLDSAVRRRNALMGWCSTSSCFFAHG